MNAGRFPTDPEDWRRHASKKKLKNLLD